jgi:hypothetical protein
MLANTTCDDILALSLRKKQSVVIEAVLRAAFDDFMTSRCIAIALSNPPQRGCRYPSKEKGRRD